ncbi:MAG: DUF2617 family protein [Sedimentisphaerales bacterium]|nr:DUF2617 family protein [Sedimentisphaerales bacterium]
MASHTKQVLLSELMFRLFDRPVHPELFDIYNSRRFFQGDYEAMLWITGCSHVISVFAHGQCLTELVCPSNQLLPQRGLVDHFDFRGEKNHQRKLIGGMDYFFSSQVEPVSDNLYRKVHDDLKKMGKKRGMLVSHSQWTKDDLTALSYVDYEARVEELHVHVFHLLPEQGVILKTQSLFSLKR